jgi:hypothetical protein
MTTAELATVGAVALALIVQTGGLFYWAGAVQQMLRDHERRLTALEASHHGK